MADSVSSQTALGMWEREFRIVEEGVVARRDARRLVEAWDENEDAAASLTKTFTFSTTKVLIHELSSPPEEEGVMALRRRGVSFPTTLGETRLSIPPEGGWRRRERRLRVDEEESESSDLIGTSRWMRRERRARRRVGLSSRCPEEEEGSSGVERGEGERAREVRVGMRVGCFLRGFFSFLVFVWRSWDMRGRSWDGMEVGVVGGDVSGLSAASSSFIMSVGEGG